MKLFNKNDAIFNSKEKNDYKEKLGIWWCTTLLCTLFPFFAQCISLIFTHNFDFFNIINNGDLVLLTYSITIPTFLELIQLETKKNTKYVIYVFVWVFLVLSDLVVYLCIKNPGTYTNENNIVETYDNFAINLFFTILILLTSIIFSQNTIKYIFIW